jgi:gamma-glutamylcyclotransferase
MPVHWGGISSVYYFAYGSNLHWPQMQLRCPSSRFICAARLPGYQFGITRHSRLRDCGTANVFPATGKEVWGAVYDVSDGDLKVMDDFEDGYRREILSVEPIGDNRQPIDVLVYVAEIENHVPLPSAEYKRLILQGAKHWQLPASYLAILEGIKAGQ